MESCVLPCSFQPGDEAVIHWIQQNQNTVHSYYRNSDQLLLQDQSFRGRTSLFIDQISSGNASLQLTGVKVQDQGRYKCYTSTITGNKESFINLNVEGMKLVEQETPKNTRNAISGVHLYSVKHQWNTKNIGIINSSSQPKFSFIINLFILELYSISESRASPTDRTKGLGLVSTQQQSGYCEFYTHTWGENTF